MIDCVLGFNVVVRNINIMMLLKNFFEFCNIDEYMNIIFFYSKEYKNCRNEINCIFLDFCFFDSICY